MNTDSWRGVVKDVTLIWIQDCEGKLIILWIGLHVLIAHHKNSKVC